jgi:putative FmdB family regulatory protein
MPVYEYTCDACQSTTEVIRPMAEMDAPIACEHCGSKKTHRALSLFLAGADKHARSASSMPTNACGRCGDPHGCCGQ